MKKLMKYGLGYLSLLTLTLVFLNGTAIAQNANNGRVPSSDAEVKLSYAPVVHNAAPAVVNIYTKRVIKTRTSPFLSDPFFSQFFGGTSTPRERIERSLGSGVIVRQDGVIVTNYHVIDGADEITVSLADRREFEAEVILKDESADLAILRITPRGAPLSVIEFSESDDIQVGDLVLAIGNPFGVGQSVTSGIVSALARTQVGDDEYQFFIQTDAAVNPGNSGGALVGMDGKLVGINTSIYSRSGGSNGIGFAIPVRMVEFVLNAALTDGKIVRPWFGASGQAVSADIAESLGLDRPGGVLIDNVYPDSPAGRAGLEPGNVILSIDGEEIFDTQGLRYFIALGKVGGETTLKVLDAGKTRDVKVKLEVAPEDPPRNITILKGDNIFENIQVGNLSPAFSNELGVNMFEKGVIILDIDRLSPVRRLNVLRPGDIFASIDGKEINSVEELQDVLDQSGTDVSFAVRRQGGVIECIARGRGSYSCR